MYRSETDLIIGFNCFAVAALSTESRALADGYLSTHQHTMAQTDHPRELMFRSRNAYARYFNTKYKRRGRLGEKQYFLSEIEGLYHTLAGLNYVNRQGLHHGLVSTPFEYPHCSANAFFRKQLGKNNPPALMPLHNRNRFLPSNISIPPAYRMNASGLLLREDILDTAYVEELYITPRSFLFQMNRIGDEVRDLEAQKKENNTTPVTLEIIERGVPDFDSGLTRTFEQGKVNYRRLTDIELCGIIDKELIPKMFDNPDEASVYSLSLSRRVKLYDWLWQKNQQSRYQQKDTLLNGKFFSEAQLKRCLCMTYSL